ncbi:hypothetical protein BpHYR1_012064 [Brachionus plicatilis]|uniref:Uncharacterized protein n=1 Tax=Brachionus plicatilis TaxID=10195 RepID=A0A3M7SSL4_BRAPC|nr:hypothetical protein BpHYR1_012064 [Brachionus plicatilis]
MYLCIIKVLPVVKAKLWRSMRGIMPNYPHMETITIKESDFLANGTDSDHEENCESEFEEVANIKTQ